MGQISPIFQQGLAAFYAGRLAEAESLFRRFLAQQPDHPDGLNMLGLIAMRAGKLEPSAELIGRAVQLAPNIPDFRNNLGMVMAMMRRFEDAIALHRQAIALKPDYAQGYNNLGNALMARGRLQEAVDAFRSAILHRPDFIEAHNNLGSAYQELPDIDQAMLSFQQALAINPNFADAHNNIGNAMKKRGALEESLAAFRKALQIKPTNAAIWNNYAGALAEAGQVEQAIAAHDRAIAAEPMRMPFASARLYMLHFLPDMPAERIFAEHVTFDRQYAAEASAKIAPHPNDRTEDRVLRVGYVSPDFRQHSVAHFLESFLQHHDPKKVEIFAYADVRTPDAITDRFRAIVKNWRDITALFHEQVEQLVRQDQIDILIDLAGHTSGARPALFAGKPAPVQMTYLGYPDTTGLSAVDWRITDAVADPRGQTEQFHSEKLLRLPECFLSIAMPEDAPAISAPPAKKKGYITFGCFSVLPKISGKAIEMWSAILKNIPDAKMIVKTRALADAATRTRLMRSFEAGGVAADRIEMRTWAIARTDHLRSFEQVDIALDTFPYTGTTLTCESLFMGVPVVTLAGQTHARRVGASLLSAVGLTDWIAQTPEQYIEIAQSHASDPAALAKIRKTLRKIFLASPLADGKRLAAALEDAYRQAWREWCQRPA